MLLTEIQAAAEHLERENPGGIQMGEWTEEDVLVLGQIRDLLERLKRACIDEPKRRLLVHPGTLLGFGSVFGLVIVRSSLVRQGTAHLMLEVG